MYVADVADHPALFKPDQMTFSERQKVRSFAGVPLVVRGETLAVICLNYHQRRNLGPRDQRIIELYTRQAAAVIAGDKFARKRMEFDLHDLVKTKLSAIKGQTNAAMTELESQHYGGDAVDRLRDVLNYCDEILSNVTTILDDLAITTPGANVLRGILERTLDRLSRSFGPPKIRVELGDALPDVPLVCAADLAYFLDQALSNARQHARAEHVSVRVTCDPDELHVLVEDDGHGFRLSELPATRTGVINASSAELTSHGYRGLASMAYRAERLGGTLLLNSQPGRGSKISLSVPIDEGIEAHVR